MSEKIQRELGELIMQKREKRRREERERERVQRERESGVRKESKKQI